MIAVGRVLQLYLPVAGKAELVGTGHLERKAAALLLEEVDPRPGVAQEIVQRLDLAVHRGEDQPAIETNFQRDERERRLVDQIAIAIGIRYADQPAVEPIAPRVVGAGERPGIALVAVAYGRAAVTAPVQHAMDLPVARPGDDNRRAADLGGLEVAGLGYLALMPAPDPGAMIDTVDLQIEDGRIDIHVGVKALALEQLLEGPGIGSRCIR